MRVGLKIWWMVGQKTRRFTLKRPQITHSWISNEFQTRNNVFSEARTCQEAGKIGRWVKGLKNYSLTHWRGCSGLQRTSRMSASRPTFVKTSSIVTQTINSERSAFLCTALSHCFLSIPDIAFAFPLSLPELQRRKPVNMGALFSVQWIPLSESTDKRTSASNI